MLLPRVYQANEPRRDEVHEADRPEDELGVGQLREVGELFGV